MSDKDELYQELRFLVRAGVSTKKDVFDLVTIRCSYGEALAAEAPKLRGFAAKLLRAREQEEAGWTDRGASDDLDDAFSELDRAGIVALQHAGWTMSMGWEDVWAEHHRRKEAGRPPRGAVFYHGQDTERGVEGHGLYLAFGAFVEEDNDPAGVAIAREVCAALARHGLAYEWGGTQSERIRVLPFPWRKRMFTTAPPAERPGPWRRLRHRDGRRWAARTVGARVEIEIVMEDGEELKRELRGRSAAEAEARAAELIAGQLADGFADEASEAG